MSAQPLSTFTALLEGKELSQWNKHLTGVGCDATMSDPTRKLVFLSSGTYPADMRAAAKVAGIKGKPKGGLEAADAVCQKLADDAGLGGIYMAWLSDDTDSPSTRSTQATVSYQLVNGTSIADNWSDLISGSLDATLSVSETGVNLAASGVWTGTNTNGTAAANNCQNWTSSDASDLGQTGDS